MSSAAPPDGETIVGLTARYRAGDLSPVEVVRGLIDRLEAVDSLVHAYLVIDAQRAVEAAQSAERQFRPGSTTPPLLGIPVAVKDVFDTQGLTTTAGARLFAGRIPNTDSAVVARLRAAGAIVVGKTNTDEFALGGTTQNPHFGGTRNPWKLDHNPGGSSGGSAAALAARLCVATVGTDTAGSVRAPAAACGVLGLKPTYGRVPLTGVFPVSWTCDHAGPMARGVADAAIMLSVIAGYDPVDPVSIERPPEDFSAELEQGIAGLRIGVVDANTDGVDQPEVAENYRAALAVFEQLGAHLHPVKLPDLRQARRTLGSIVEAEAAEVHRQLFEQHQNEYSLEVRQRIERGRQAGGAELTRAYVERHALLVEHRRVLADLDALVLPAAAATAPAIGEEIAREVLYRYFASFNLSGAPVVSMPTGFDRQGLPTGMQIVGQPWRESRLLRVARAYERVTPWLGCRPASIEPGGASRPTLESRETVR